MYQFHTDGSAAGLAYQVDFARADYANISFFDASRTDILFHLSLRQTAGQAVFNRRIDDEWAAEQPVPVAFQPGPNLVALALGPDGATVTLNGAVVMTLDAGLCPDLHRIAWHDGQGGIDAHSFQLTGPANLARKGLGGLVYVAPFAAEGWGVDPAVALQDLTLQVPGLAEALQPVTLPRPDLATLHGLTALPQSVQIVVPGRVWLDVPDNAGLSLRLTANGVPCGAPLRLSREAILTAIEELAARDPDSTAAEAQAFDAMLAFEHVQHGRFWPRLSPAARAYLSRTARAYHLDDLMPALTGESDSAPPAPTDPASAIPLDLQLMETARGALVQRLRADPSADPIAAMRALPDLSDSARQSLFHGMTEYFCTIDRFADLYQLAAAEGLAQPMHGRSAWDLSVSLPWLLMGRRYDALSAALWDLVPVQGGWFSTASLAWVIRRATRTPDLSAPPDHLERLAYALIDFIARRAVLYWERSSCSHLMDAMIDLMAAQPRLPDYLADPVTMAALRAYGLSRRFWDKLDAAADRLPPSPAVSAARHAFQTLLDPTASPADLDTALTHFDRLGAAEVERLRREMLGPLGFAPGAPQSLLPRLLAAETDTAGDIALRALAFPAATPLLPPSDAEALAPLIRRTVKSRYVETGKARMFTAQDAASRRLMAYLGDLALAGPTAAMDTPLADVLADVSALSAPDNRFLGLALGLGALDGLLRLGAADPARRVQVHLGATLSRMDPVDRRAMQKAPAVLSALSALWPRRADPMLAALSGDFADAMASLSSAPPTGDLPGGGVFNAIVVVLSCQPYLNSRIPVLQQHWLDRLADLGIPHLVAVGGAKGPAHLDGMVLHLDAPDDYEGLPQKTLAAIAWVHANTGFGHMIKVDDDCFMDVDGYFHGQNWRKFDYHGRKLARYRGDTDRIWHQAKSTSARGRLELDKSPEPSIYCDGGSGYALSRHAMAEILRLAATAQGGRLVQSSFMEDKMVGDLLAMAAIAPMDEDYLAVVQRRGAPGGIPVSRWANGFWPSRASGVQLVHLDDTEAQARAADLLPKVELFPKKIWPSYSRATLLHNTNLLELVSPVDKLHRLNAAPLAVVAAMRNEMFMLPHFLRHYRALGVTCFLVADNLSDDGTLEYLAEQPDVAVFSADTEYRVSQYGVAWQHALMSNFRLGRWSLVADADEFLVLGNGATTDLTATLEEPGFAHADAARIFMLDMYPDGPLSAATFASGDPFAEAGFCDRDPFLTTSPARGPYGDQPTWTSALRHRLVPGSRAELFVAQKIALLKYQPWMKLSAGLHYVADVRLAERQFLFAHFKYQAEFRAKTAREVARRQHFNDAEEYRRYLALMQEGRDVIHVPGLSVPWSDSPDVRRILSL